MSLCSEMGFSPDETKALSIKDFTIAYEGYQRQLEEKWDMVRHLMWATMSFSGMGLKKPISVQDVMTLSRDKPQKKVYIKTRAQAIQFLSNF